MTKKKIVIGGVIILFLVVTTLVFTYRPKKNSLATSFKSINLNEISQHNSASSCWMVINDQVYDVTGYIPNHPGGNMITAGCGQDATNLFLGQGHNSRASGLLVQMKIGVLAK